MDTRYLLSTVSDDDVVTRLSELVGIERCVLADVLAHIAEVDVRKIYLAYGCSSMYGYCTRVLGMPESGAYRRICAARLARRWPRVFADVAAGQLSLSGLNVLAPHVGDDDALLRAARGKSTRAIKQMVASVHPSEDVPDSVTPISDDRVVVRFCASTAFRDKLDEAKALLSHSVPDGRLEDVLERALDAVIDKTRKRRFARTDAPRQPRSGGTRTRHVPAPVKRAIIARDGERCTFVGKDGRRCDARAFVQFHHDDAFGRGGDHDDATMRLLCAGHNGLLAEQEYGREHMAKLSGHRAKVSGELAPARVIRTPGQDNRTPEPETHTPGPEMRTDAISALLNLGFQAAPARRAVSAAAASLQREPTFDDLIKSALRHVCPRPAMS